MRKVNLQYAKDHLDDLVEEAIAGEEVVIARGGASLVRLTPLDPGGARTKEREQPRREKIQALCDQLRALPDLDPREPDEILGYDDRGLF
jgi:antitoxin (DNA-binding transcriptional repressor) of toxin-antitoxin stability system